VRPPDKAPSLKELGLGKRQASRAEKLHKIGRTVRKKLEAELKADGNPVDEAGLKWGVDAPFGSAGSIAHQP
jgi:hypothetical protein